MATALYVSHSEVAGAAMAKALYVSHSEVAGAG
jgi:hypothetical protein